MNLYLSASDRLGLLFLPIGIILLLVGAYLGRGRGHILYLLAFTAPGIPFTVMGVFFQVIIGRERARKQKLLDDGRYILAEITGVHETGRRKGRFYCTAEAEDKVTGKRLSFRSSVVPSSRVHLQIHDRIRVYVDTQEPSNYYMELVPVLK